MPENFTLLTLEALTLRTLLFIAVFLLAAIFISLLSSHIAHRIVSLGRFASIKRRPSVERTHTLKSLVASTITFGAILFALTATLALFIPATTLIWILGLFSAAFGLGARPLVSDLLSGISFIFNGTFDIGEKVEFIFPGGNIQGVVEEVNLTTTLIRASTGEMYTFPNGEVRIVRNFTRGKFSNARINLYVLPQDVGRATTALANLSKDVFSEMDDLMEPYQVIGSENLSGSKVEIIINAKAALGKAAELRLRLMDRIQERLQSEGIQLAG